MVMPSSYRDREQDKFGENIDGKTAVRILPSTSLLTITDKASGSVTYIGESLIGSLVSQSFWRIQKVEKIGNITTIKFADSNGLFDNIWNDRATYTYG